MKQQDQKTAWFREAGTGRSNAGFKKTWSPLQSAYCFKKNERRIILQIILILLLFTMLAGCGDKPLSEEPLPAMVTVEEVVTLSQDMA